MNVKAYDAWLESMRTERGYGGPVAHWWQQSLMYCGAGLDWRYEGIIAGYLALWKRTGANLWLQKARRAADDLVDAQSDGGHFPNSGFERNPSTAGTPHEAACSLGLLLLAHALPETNSYLQSAEKNLRQFYVAQLWDDGRQRFRDGIGTDTFVPNKAATACEAFFMLAKLTDDADWVDRYVLPTLEHILAHQVTAAGRLHGAFAQNSIGSKRIDKYFPIYIARCVPALLHAYEWTGQERFLAAANDALSFIERWIQPDGTVPTVIYGDASVNRYPSWVAALGDVLRAGELGVAAGLAVSFAPLRALLKQDDSGAIQTARGFAAQHGGRLPKLRDVRDLLHVTGWNDKAFRYLAAYGELTDSERPIEFEREALFRGKRVQFVESANAVTITRKQEMVYLWRKGTDYPDVASAEFWLR